MHTTARFARIVAAAAVLATAACEQKLPEHGTLIQNPEPAPALHLTDTAGRPWDLAALHGQLTFVYFGYTHCPDACPTTLTDWARARALLGPSGSAIHFVFVSVDPARDTPEIAAHYAHQFDSTFTGDYGVAHPAGVYFIDKTGLMKFVFAPGSKPAELASDLKLLM
jgi:protein SCO1/2